MSTLDERQWTTREDLVQGTGLTWTTREDLVVRREPKKTTEMAEVSLERTTPLSPPSNRRASHAPRQCPDPTYGSHGLHFRLYFVLEIISTFTPGHSSIFQSFSVFQSSVSVSTLHLCFMR